MPSQALTPIKDVYYVVFLGLTILFGLVYDWRFGLIYLAIIVWTYVLEKSKNFVSIPLDARKGVWPYIEALLAAALVFAISIWLTKTFEPQLLAAATAPQAVLTMLAAATPIFAGSLFFAFVASIIMTPTIENTWAFGRMLEWWAALLERITGKPVPLEFKTRTLPMLTIVIVWNLLWWMALHFLPLGLRGLPLVISGIFALAMSIESIRHKMLGPTMVAHAAWNGLIFWNHIATRGAA